ncbi:MAG TPA: hypothetical protein VF990_15020 [Candidatus Dormibacteraeota bacterium]
MKRKRQERVERRRPLVEINLIGEPKSRSAKIARRGCALFAPAAGVLVALAATLMGLR